MSTYPLNAERAAAVRLSGRHAPSHGAVVGKQGWLRRDLSVLKQWHYRQKNERRHAITIAKIARGREESTTLLPVLAALVIAATVLGSPAISQELQYSTGNGDITLRLIPPQGGGGQDGFLERNRKASEWLKSEGASADSQMRTVDAKTMAGLLKSASYPRRLAAAEALGSERMRGTANVAVPALIDLVKTDLFGHGWHMDSNTRKAAAESLANFGAEAESAIPVLSEVLNDKHFREQRGNEIAADAIAKALTKIKTDVTARQRAEAREQRAEAPSQFISTPIVSFGPAEAPTPSFGSAPYALLESSSVPAVRVPGAVEACFRGESQPEGRHLDFGAPRGYSPWAPGPPGAAVGSLAPALGSPLGFGPGGVLDPLGTRYVAVNVLKKLANAEQELELDFRAYTGVQLPDTTTREGRLERFKIAHTLVDLGVELGEAAGGHPPDEGHPPAPPEVSDWIDEHVLFPPLETFRGWLYPPVKPPAK